jgi:hypothetical protein
MISGPASAVPIFYASETTFDSDNPGLTVEDFEDVNVAAGGVKGCPAPATSASVNTCFDAGDISPGLSITDVGTVPDPANALAIAGQGFAGQVPDRVIVTNYFVETFEIDFSPAVEAVGLSLVAYFGGGPCHVFVTTAAGTVNSAATCSTGGTFLGVASIGDPITKIEVRSDSGFQAEGVRSMKFGTPSTCGRGGLAGRTIAETVTGTNINETGPVSSQLHGDVEPAAGPAGPAVHEVSCVAAAAGA